MGWAASDNLHQIYENIPKKAFEKARKVYGTRMQYAPTNPVDKNEIITNFDELLSFKKLIAKKRRWMNRTMAFFTFLTIILGTLYVMWYHTGYTWIIPN